MPGKDFKNSISLGQTVLMIVDMQKYYLDRRSDFYRFFEGLYPGCMGYITRRCEEIVVPNIKKLLSFFREFQGRTVYLRLCGTDPERKDLHRFFRNSWLRGRQAGYPSLYPLESEAMSDIIDEISPLQGDTILTKTTFSAFNSTEIDRVFREWNVKEIVFTGLATSQCVETTARDASERGYEVVLLEDAQADYDEATHNASLLSSRGVCGGGVFETEGYIDFSRRFLLP